MKSDILMFEVDGKKVYIEGDVPQTSGTFVAAVGDKEIIAVVDSFEQTIEPVFAFAKSIVNKVNNLHISKPTEVELEFGIKLTSKINAWVISGTGEGTINLKLPWKTDSK
jgi:hypothetical protein